MNEKQHRTLHSPVSSNIRKAISFFSFPECYNFFPRNSVTFVSSDVYFPDVLKEKIKELNRLYVIKQFP